jgi:hypothetical protein
MIAAAMIIAAAPIGISAESAAATSPVVLVSTDGITYSPKLNVGLFTGSGLLVPGDTETAELWIKNPTADPATVRVSVAAIQTSSTALGKNMSLSVLNTSANATVTRTWDELADCDVMVQPATLAGGAVLHVTLILTMLDATGAQAQHESASLKATVAMWEAKAGYSPASTCDPSRAVPAADPSGRLGFTGETFPTELTIAAGLLLGVGWFLVALRRRRRESEEES